MYFNTIKEINKAIEAFPLTYNGTRTTYSVMFKKAVCEFMERTNTTPYELNKSVRMTAALLAKWQDQYKEGLYSLEGTWSVSKKSLKSNKAILAQLNTEVNLLQRKIELVKQCESLGIQVTLPKE